MKTRFNLSTAITALVLGTGCLWPPQAMAADVTIGSLSFPTVGKAISALGTSTYVTLIPDYTEFSSATISFTVSTSEAISLVYAVSETGAGAPEITVLDSATGEELASFDGETRADAEVLMRAFLTGLFGKEVEAFELLVANTPDDPVAGNPASLQTTMTNSTFNSGTDVGPSALTGGARGRGTLGRSHLGVSLQSGRYTGPGFSANITSLPLSYTMPFDDPRWALKLDAPLTFATVNGQDTFSGSIGVGLRIPVYDHWTLTPELRLGMTRNSALSINATLLNASITSNYRKSLRNGYQLVFGNSLTYSKSLTTSGVNYGVENVINKNGIEISGPTEFQLFGLPTNWQFSAVHTKIYGNPTYIDEWVDVSASIGTIASKNGVTWDSVRLGVTLTRANRGVKGINFNFGYEF